MYGIHWAIIFVQAAIMMASPILYGVARISIGQLQALFNLILQSKRTVDQLSNCRERLHVAAGVIHDLAELLNDGHGELLELAGYSKRQLEATEYMVGELQMDLLYIALRRVHYVAPQEHDAVEGPQVVEVAGR